MNKLKEILSWTLFVMGCMAAYFGVLVLLGAMGAIIAKGYQWTFNLFT